MFKLKTLITTFVCLCLTAISLHASASPVRGVASMESTARLIASASVGHCEIPCGIYDDHAEIQRMLLDAETMRKASAQITALAEQIDAASLNTISRWVAVKEEHSRNIQHVNAWYFMTQRIKPVAPGADGYELYVTRLTAHHDISVASMKAAQSLDPTVQDRLASAIQNVSKWYPATEKRSATHEDDSAWTSVARRE